MRPGQNRQLALNHLQALRRSAPAVYARFIAPHLNYILAPVRNPPVGRRGLGDWLTGGTGTTYDPTTGLTTPDTTIAQPIDTSGGSSTDTSSGSTSSGSSWIDNLTSLLPSASTLSSWAQAGTQAYAQYQLTQTNLSRAKLGLPALTSAQYAQYAPGVGVQVGLTSSTTNLLMYGALGLGALFVIMQVMKGKRA